MVTTDQPDSKSNRWRELMVKVQSGDKQAYRILLLELYDDILRFCRRKVGYLDIEEDCVQEILMAVHKARHTYDPNYGFSPWLYTIASNKLIDVVRKKTRTIRREIFDVDTIERAVDQTTDHSTRQGVAEELEKSLQSLKPKYKEAFTLLKIEGLSVKSAATKLGISESALKTRASRAYEMLRKNLEKDSYVER